MVRIFTVEVISTSIPLLSVFQTSPGLLPEAGFLGCRPVLPLSRKREPSFLCSSSGGKGANDYGAAQDWAGQVRFSFETREAP